MRRAVGAILAAAALAPGSASAQQPAAAELRIVLENTRTAGVALPGDRVRVRGTLSPWVEGQEAIVRVYPGSCSRAG